VKKADMERLDTRMEDVEAGTAWCSKEIKTQQIKVAEHESQLVKVIELRQEVMELKRVCQAMASKIVKLHENVKIHKKSKDGPRKVHHHKNQETSEEDN
jgi:hypothetical protein